MRGYKVFNSDWTCRDFQFAVGETYSLPAGQHPVACKQGFHFCERAIDCFSYYDFDPKNKVAVVEAIGEIVIAGDKSCTSSLKIVEEVSWEKVLTLVNVGAGNSGNRNSGNWNSGDSNSGNWNSGDSNSGNRNSGDRNSGDRNSGNRNSGDSNSGNRNSGDRNSGYWNSGDRNSGNRNSGNWNSGDRNCGYLNSISPDTILVFNKECKLSDWEGAIVPNFFYFECTAFVDTYEMTDAEKQQHPEYETIGGYLKTLSYKEAWQESYRKASKEDREKVKKLPNFDADVFFEITGVRVE